MAHIPFFCAVCGASLSAEVRLAGGVCECPDCERRVPVPGFPLHQIFFLDPVGIKVELTFDSAEL